MENFEEAIQLIRQGDFMAYIDLKAYYSVRIAEEHQKIFVSGGQVIFSSSHVFLTVLRRA